MKRIPLFFLSLATWILLVWKFDLENLLAGIIIAAVGAFLFGGIGMQGLDGSVFSISKIPGFLNYVFYTLILWMSGGIGQIKISLFSGAENEQISGSAWINTVLLKTSSKFFLVHALYYAPNLIVLDVEKDRILVKWCGADASGAAKAEKTVRELEKRIAGVFE